MSLEFCFNWTGRLVKSCMTGLKNRTGNWSSSSPVPVIFWSQRLDFKTLLYPKKVWVCGRYGYAVGTGMQQVWVCSGYGFFAGYGYTQTWTHAGNAIPMGLPIPVQSTSVLQGHNQ